MVSVPGLEVVGVMLQVVPWRRGVLEASSVAARYNDEGSEKPSLPRAVGDEKEVRAGRRSEGSRSTAEHIDRSPSGVAH